MDLFSFFNAGDIISLRQHVDEHFVTDCMLKTTSLSIPLSGREHVCAFFTALLDSHADAVWRATNFRYADLEVGCCVHFAGSKVTTTAWDYLFDSQQNTETMTRTEQLRHEQLTKSTQLKAIANKGCVVFKMNEALQVKGMDLNWSMTSLKAMQVE